MTQFLHVLKDLHSGRLWSVTGYSEINSEINSEIHGKSVLKRYILHNDGSLTPVPISPSVPPRMFTMADGYGALLQPFPEHSLQFDGHSTYYEVLDDGDTYKRVTDEELAVLREKARNR